MEDMKIVVGDDAGAALRKAKEIEGLNNNQIAERMGCSRQSVQQSLGRRSGNLRALTMVRMALALGWTVTLQKIR